MATEGTKQRAAERFLPIQAARCHQDSGLWNLKKRILCLAIWDFLRKEFGIGFFLSSCRNKEGKKGLQVQNTHVDLLATRTLSDGAKERAKLK